MKCDEVREQLAEHLLGTLEGPADLEVRRHLRGCASCRREMAALAEGVSTFARAAHDLQPPEELRDRVMSVLEEEWASPAAEPAPSQSRFGRAWLGRAAVAVSLIGALTWGGLMTSRAGRFEALASKYDSFLGALGGENVRVGQLHSSGPQTFSGSVVVYDSKVQQSWVLVLVRAPGMQGTANVTLLSEGHEIDMHPLQFGGGGEASSWLVTSADLRGFDHVDVWNENGLIASAQVQRD